MSDPTLVREVRTGSAEETRALGERLGRVLQPGDFVGLVGELGAGKTQFVRGVADGVGVDRSQVASPSFAIVYPYEGGRVPLFHADLYRLADYDELYGTGFIDLIGGEGALLVEWIDKVPQAAPQELLLIRFELDLASGPDARRIAAMAFGDRYAQRAAEWLGSPENT
ncbi:MAG: tRNA (adenosine(37)-N6)-threonylcarbamoyltransferase complex ATPase subunit type 1 TsaE [Myxococcaceae bacterium]|nr:tRNA (adenosine(37)-N6)-threonylcarbamoyltransferase complex ATPase subunit type 1 TsaE [Myxococcaceae bacterium]